jgi:hypothetical protein
VNPVSYSMDTWSFTPGLERPERKVNHSRLSRAEVENECSSASHPCTCVHGVDRNTFVSFCCESRYLIQIKNHVNDQVFENKLVKKILNLSTDDFHLWPQETDSKYSLQRIYLRKTTYEEANWIQLALESYRKRCFNIT